MSKQKKIHLFNCDRTYKLDAVEKWLTTANDTGFELTTDPHNFTLPQMAEWSSKKIPELDMDVAVFVVHAHESRLSINEDNAGIGYATIYRALLQKTGGKVIIVIGGDDSYKDEDEEGKEFISRWARRKISSQFSEEFMDGRKSFIFSWDKKHRKIHEEALLHFLDPNKKGEKFEYQPPARRERREEEKFEYQPPAKPRKLPPKPATPPHVRPSESEAFSRPYSSLPAEGPYTGERVQSNKPVVPVKSKADPTSDQGARAKDNRSSIMETKVFPLDLAVLGCSVSEGSIYAVMQEIESIRPKANLHATPPVENLSPAEVKTYLKRNWLKFCVLVVDAKTVKDAYENLPKRRAEYEDLLKTAVDRVVEKVIILVCDSLSLPQEDETIIHQAIYRIIKERDKGFVAWLKNGKLTVDPDVLVQLFVSPKPTMGHVIPQSSRPERSQRPTNAPSFRATESRRNYVDQPRGRVVLPLEQETRYGLEKPNMQQPQGAIQQSYLPANSTYTSDNPSTGKPVLKSKLRYGRISYQKEDMELHSSEFQGIPDETTQNLLKNYRYTPEIQVKVMSDPKYNTVCQVLLGDFSKNEGVQLADNETLVFKSRVRNGLVSNDKDDVEFRYPGWKIPVHLLEDLKHKASDGKLFIISNEKGNLRCKVQGAGVKDKAVAAKDKVVSLFPSNPFKKCHK